MYSLKEPQRFRWNARGISIAYELLGLKKGLEIDSEPNL